MGNKLECLEQKFSGATDSNIPPLQTSSAGGGAEGGGNVSVVLHNVCVLMDVRVCVYVHVRVTACTSNGLC